MCIRVETTPRTQLEDPWDAARQVIIIPAELTDAFVLRAVRAVLHQLDVPQGNTGARCWCGEPIDLLPRIPQQRRSGQVMAHGA